MTVNLTKDATVTETLRLLDRLSDAGRLPPGLLLPWVSRCITRFGADPDVAREAGASDGAVRTQVLRLRRAIRRNTTSGVETTVFMDASRFRPPRYVSPGGLSARGRYEVLSGPMTSDDETRVTTCPPTPTTPPPGEEGFGWQPSKTVAEALRRAQGR